MPIGDVFVKPDLLKIGRRENNLALSQDITFDLESWFLPLLLYAFDLSL